MNMTWINRGVYELLERIGNFQFYFMSVARWAAAICFLVALGYVCIQIFMQACDPRKELIRLLVTVVTYFIMIYFFPIVMKNLLSFGMNLGYGAVFEQGLYEAKVGGNDSSFKGSESEFYKWLDEESGGIFSTTESEDGSKVALNFNLVDSKTGYIDLNKTFSYILCFVKIGWKAFPKLTLFKASFTAIGICALYLFALIVVIICYFVVLINYVMALIDYFALMGYGILMIPLSLWSGTKGYTQAVLSAIGKILVKLICISSLMFLSIMSIVDLFTQVYVHSVLVNGVSFAAEIDDLLNMSVTLLFQAPLLAVITMQTEKIANFLCSGHPSLSFGDFALGGAQTAAMAGGAAMGANHISKAASAASSSVSSGIVGGMAAKQMGGGFKSIAKSALGSASSTIGGTLKGNMGNVSSSLKTGLNGFSQMTGMTRGGGLYHSIPKTNGSKAFTSNVGGNSGKENASDFLNDMKDRGNNPSSSSLSNEEELNTEPTNDALSSFENGMEGVYGNVSRNKEDQNLNDKATVTSNRMSQGGLSSRIMAGHIGEVSEIVSSISNTHKERKNGNKDGNGYIKNAAKSVLSSRISQSANSYGGSKVSFSKSDMKAPEALRGKSAGIIARGNGSKSFDMGEGRKGHNNFIIKSDKDFYDSLKNSGGPTDEDAIKNIEEINGEKE